MFCFMTDSFPVLVYCHSKTFHLIVYQSINQMAYDINFTSQSNQLDYKRLLGLVYLVSLLKYVCPLAVLGLILIGPCFCGGD